MDNSKQQVVDIFVDVSKKLEKHMEGNTGTLGSNLDSLEMLKLENYFSREFLCVVPLVDGRDKDNNPRGIHFFGDVRGPKVFSRLTKPTEYYNAVAALVVGHGVDRFDTYAKGSTTRRTPSGGYIRDYKGIEDFIKNDLLPRFLTALNDALAGHTVNGKALKAKIVNGSFDPYDETSFSSTQYVGDLPYYSPRVLPLAIQITFA